MSCERVSPCDVEGLSAAMFVARHAGSGGCFALPALVLADVTCLGSCTCKQKGQEKSVRQTEKKKKKTYDCTEFQCEDEFSHLVVALLRHRLKYDGLHR